MLSRLLLVPVALALATPAVISVRDEADPPPELLLRYHYDSGSNQTELSLSSVDKTDVYAHVCGDSFEIGGKTLTINVNEKGSGSVLVDDKEYKVVGDRQASGGAACKKMYNEGSTVVECTVPWPAGLAEDFPTLSADDVEECFTEESAVTRRRSLPPTFGHPFASAPSEFEKRQDLCTTLPPKTKLVGDGNPHQDHLHRQVGPSQHCAQAGSCFVGVGEEASVSITAEVLGIGPWISGGFSVSFTKSSSTERGCYGEPGDTVCQWAKMHHTAYTVTTTRAQPCSIDEPFSESDPYVIRSPNDNSIAVEWYCVLNTCRGDGDQYWELGRAGGP